MHHPNDAASQVFPMQCIMLGNVNELRQDSHMLAGELVSLEKFVKTTLGRFLVASGDRDTACRVTYDHQQASPRPKQVAGGDSFQGL